MSVTWAYGVTTIPQRREKLLTPTLASLREAGFDKPRLFVDGTRDASIYENEFDLETTVRFPAIRAYGNWMLSLAELYIRNPTAERFAIFQDDLIASRNLRQYLESSVLDEKIYLNLYTSLSNHKIRPRDSKDQFRIGWYKSNQFGRGALALVFSRATVIDILSCRYMTERPLNPLRGWKSIDGGICDGLKPLGYKELVHNPSLVKHTGLISSFDKRKDSLGLDENYPKHFWAAHDNAQTFRGESFDCLELLKYQTINKQ